MTAAGGLETEGEGDVVDAAVGGGVGVGVGVGGDESTEQLLTTTPTAITSTARAGVLDLRRICAPSLVPTLDEVDDGCFGRF